MTFTIDKNGNFVDAMVSNKAKNTFVLKCDRFRRNLRNMSETQKTQVSKLYKDLHPYYTKDQ